MHELELREYITLYKELFGKYKFWIVDAKSECFLIKICQTTVWLMNKDDYSFNITDKFCYINFPIRVEPSEHPPFDCIGLLYQSNKNLRLGQWFMNHFDPSGEDIVLYNEHNFKIALQMIYKKYYLV